MRFAYGGDFYRLLRDLDSPTGRELFDLDAIWCVSGEAPPECALRLRHRDTGLYHEVHRYLPVVSDLSVLPRGYGALEPARDGQTPGEMARDEAWTVVYTMMGRYLYGRFGLVELGRGGCGGGYHAVVYAPRPGEDYERTLVRIMARVRTFDEFRLFTMFYGLSLVRP
jgi:hypothetical protein